MNLTKPRLAVLEWASQGRVYDITAPQAVTAASLVWAINQRYIIAYTDEGGPAYEITEAGRKALEEAG